jgi:hypothetical protein
MTHQARTPSAALRAAVNYAFIEHFQDVARGHFTVRRLERAYGKELVRKEYERLAQEYCRVQELILAPSRSKRR